MPDHSKASDRMPAVLEPGEYVLAKEQARTAAEVGKLQINIYGAIDGATAARSVRRELLKLRDHAAIHAGKRKGDPALRSTWALPHHPAPGEPADSAMVRACLERLPKTKGLVDPDAARAHLEAHMSELEERSDLPRENLVRAIYPGVEVRSSDGDGMPTMVGQFTKYGEWTEINSFFEGRFMERIAPGAAARSLADHTPKVLFQHGQDPQIGDKVLGIPTALRDEPTGPAYEVPLFDTTYNRDLIPGLEAGAYGASFRFSVVSETFVKAPERSDYNPDGLPERTITEMRVAEFGPVTFPAYAGATAGIRSMTDDFRPGARPSVKDAVADMARTKPGELARLIQDALPPATEEKPLEDKPPARSTPPEVPAKSTKEARTMFDPDQYQTVEDLSAALEDVKARISAKVNELGIRRASETEQAELDDLVADRREIEATIAEFNKRRALLAEAEKPVIVDGGARERGERSWEPPAFHKKPENIYDMTQYRTGSSTPEGELRAMRDGAMRSVEGARFPHPNANRETVQGHIANLLDTDADNPQGVGAEVARRILTTGSPTYKRALGKYIKHGGNLGALSPEEQRALSVGTGSAGGFAVVYQLDPTLVPTSNYSVNPWRALASVETIAGTNEWKAVTSGAITAAYSAEATEASDNAPTLAQPDIIVEKAQAYVPFSIEVGQDWEGLQAGMAMDLSDAKDDLEATKFATGAGHGSQEPKGVITGATNTTGTTTTQTFVVADLYKVFEALPPRFRPRSQFAANLFVIDKIRQFDTSGGSGVWAGPNSFGLQQQSDAGGAGTIASSVGIPLLGRRVYEATAMGSALTTTTKILLVGDFRYFKIIDRVGMDIEIMPLVVGTAHRPTGQRGLYAYWRNSSDVLSAAAFQVLVT